MQVVRDEMTKEPDGTATRTNPAMSLAIRPKNNTYIAAPQVEFRIERQVTLYSADFCFWSSGGASSSCHWQSELGRCVP